MQSLNEVGSPESRGIFFLKVWIFTNSGWVYMDSFKNVRAVPAWLSLKWKCPCMGKCRARNFITDWRVRWKFCFHSVSENSCRTFTTNLYCGLWPNAPWFLERRRRRRRRWRRRWYAPGVGRLPVPAVVFWQVVSFRHNTGNILHTQSRLQTLPLLFLLKLRICHAVV